MASIAGTYWEGQIPGDTLSIQVRDDRNTSVDLSSYTSFRLRMLDSDNSEVDLTGSDLDTSNAYNGRLIFAFPTDRSLFTKYGDYVAQLEMSGAGKKDFTSTFILKVKKLGRK